MKRRAAPTVCLLLLSGLLPLDAQAPPPAEELIKRYVEAIGGRMAHLDVTSVRMSGTVEMASLGTEGEFELLRIRPDRMKMRMTLGAVGEIVTGYDGRVGWRVSPLTGPSLMDGAELAHTIERASTLGRLRDPELLRTRETVESAVHGGEACWRVHLVWESGRETFDCYSQNTGLLVASEDVQASPMGEVAVTTVYSGYEEIRGLRFPTRMDQQTMGQRQVVNIRDIRLNDADPSELEPPERIRALLD